MEEKGEFPVRDVKVEIEINCTSVTPAQRKNVIKKGRKRVTKYSNVRVELNLHLLEQSNILT